MNYIVDPLNGETARDLTPGGTVLERLTEEEVKRDLPVVLRWARQFGIAVAQQVPGQAFLRDGERASLVIRREIPPEVSALVPDPFNYLVGVASWYPHLLRPHVDAISRSQGAQAIVVVSREEYERPECPLVQLLRASERRREALARRRGR